MSADYDFVIGEGKIVAVKFSDNQTLYLSNPAPLEEASKVAQRVDEFRNFFQFSVDHINDKTLVPKILEFLKTITPQQRDAFIRPLAEAGKKGVPKSEMKDQGPSLAGRQATMTMYLEGMHLPRLWEKYNGTGGEEHYRIIDDYLEAVREALKLI